jgi:hypothetical protein
MHRERESDNTPSNFVIVFLEAAIKEWIEEEVEKRSFSQCELHICKVIKENILRGLEI